MKDRLSRNQIFDIFYVLSQEIKEDDVTDKRFAFASSRMKDLLRDEVKAILEARQSSIPEYKEVENKRKAIQEKFCEKDENGAPIIIDETFAYKKDKAEEIKKQLEALNEEYKDVIEKRNEEIKQYNELIEEEIEVDVCKVTFRAFPQNMKEYQINILKPMIKETDAEMEAILVE